MKYFEWEARHSREAGENEDEICVEDVVLSSDRTTKKRAH